MAFSSSACFMFFVLFFHGIRAAIRGYGLESFITKDATAPPEYIAAEERADIQVNPDFALWNRQDQFLASWILSSLSESILILTVGLHTSKDIWLALEKTISAQSLAKVMQYKIQLQTMRKAGLTMREYLNKMKMCFDVLASAGKKIEERDQNFRILTGLGHEYNSVMVSVTSRTESYTLTDLYALLLCYESRLESQNISS
ncbi:hypothetical protein DH2020_045346 [Rehmannia glutinosa]|uniref:Uncharacterized protein n=1 Tax=Rehmannia glutinosa TaxID=99300 RepID=A0ABR0UG42_REHGL